MTPRTPTQQREAYLTKEHAKRPEAKRLWSTAPLVAIGSIFSRHNLNHSGSVFRMRYYQPNARSMPSRPTLPCIAVGIATINGAHLVRLIEHLHTDERYDYFSFENVPQDEARALEIRALQVPCSALRNWERS